MIESLYICKTTTTSLSQATVISSQPCTLQSCSGGVVISIHAVDGYPLGKTGTREQPYPWGKDIAAYPIKRRQVEETRRDLEMVKSSNCLQKTSKTSIFRVPNEVMISSLLQRHREREELTSFAADPENS